MSTLAGMGGSAAKKRFADEVSKFDTSALTRAKSRAERALRRLPERLGGSGLPPPYEVLPLNPAA